MSQNKLDSLTETQVVARIARKDNYEDIIDDLEQKGITVTKGTITNIKKRNAEALSYMQNVMTEQAASHSLSILQKSRQLLERKLDRDTNLEDELKELRRAYDDGEFEDYTKYQEARERLLRRELSASELNAITKESFNQSQVEQGKPSSITDNPTQAKANVERLLIAIKQGDDKAILSAIFPDAQP